jgi:hypothetical protein
MFECPTRDAHAPKPVANPWLPSHPEPPSPESTVYGSTVSSTMSGTPSATSTAPASSFIAGSTVDYDHRNVHAPRPGVNPGLHAYPEPAPTTVYSANSHGGFSRTLCSTGPPTTASLAGSFASESIPLTASKASSTLSSVPSSSTPSKSKRKRPKPKRKRPASGDDIDKLIAKATKSKN